MIIWNQILECHDIRVNGSVRAQLDKYLGGTALPNKSVTIEQAETVVTNFINAALAGVGYHIYIHIFSFPKKTEENTPFDYALWIGLINDVPAVLSGRINWWDR